MYPSYLDLSKSDWQKRIKKAYRLLNPCQVCPRKCGVNRLKDQKTGFCQMGINPLITSYHPHHGEESCLSGWAGSGTIFFTSCNLACVYCQNFEISQLRVGKEITIEQLSNIMLNLQRQGCHNINLVSPSIWVPQILKALFLAKNDLKIPIVYNTGGYDSVQTLKLLKEIVDIYMPDIKYSSDKIGLKYSLVKDYWTQVKKAVTEMYRQVGELIIDKHGLAKRGLLIRHLVLPNNLAGTKKVMKFIAQKISKNTYVNIMAQYYPTNKAHLYPELSRRITPKEFEKAIKTAKDCGLHRFDKIQIVPMKQFNHLTM